MVVVESSSQTIMEVHASLAVSDEDEEENPKALYWDWRMKLLSQARWGAKELDYLLMQKGTADNEDVELNDEDGRPDG